MKILLTGAAGFIGQNLERSYIEAGHTVIGLDRKPGVTLQLDLQNIEWRDLIPLLSNVDVISHHAAQVDVRTSLKDPLYDAQENIIVTLKLLQAAREAGVKRFVFASSGGAIGPVDCPSTPYGISKLTIERYLGLFLSSMEVVTLRYSNVYGPYQYSGVIAVMFRSALQNKPMIINGDGTQTRDYIYVGDVVRANISALNAPSDVYNISTGLATSLNELVPMVNRLHPLSYAYAPPILGEVQDSCLTPSSLKGWNPSTSLEEGLRQTFEYYRSVY